MTAPQPTSRFRAWQIILFVVVWPVGLAVFLHWLWTRSSWSRAVKISISVASALLVIPIVVMSIATSRTARPSGQATGPSQPPATAPSATASPTPSPTPPASTPSATSDQQLWLSSDPRLLPPGQEPSAKCLTAFRALAASEGNWDDEWTPYLIATLKDCRNVAGFRYAVGAYPAALGFTADDDLIPMDLYTICGEAAGDVHGQKYPVCRDARRLGFLPPP